ncbi:MAG TPA: AAA family ATPase, partial [Candidatus Limnocylindrales bacterium]|nr:AAA family ATPase [Candidatus Limnocylindrales bacterium]
MADEIIGRGVELVAIEQFLDRARAGIAALVLDGEAGIGKTTLWERAVARADAGRFHVLQSRPGRAEHDLALGGLTDLFDGIGDRVLAALPDPQRHALEVALLRVAPAGSPPDQRALSVAVAATLRALAAEAPIVLAVDDAQWLDVSSAAVLAYAVRRLADRRIGLVLSVRAPADDGIDGQLPQRDDRAGGLIAAVPADRVQRLEVGPLALGSLHHLFQARLGRSFPRLALVRIEAASGGNPLYALEIARALDDATLPTDPNAPLPVPGSLGSLLDARIRALPGATRQAMLLAAAAAEPAIATLERAGPGAGLSLAPAVAAGVVALGDDVVRFRHPLYAQAVLGLATPSEVRAANAALALATTSSDARARHLGLAADAPDERVAAALADSADRSRRRGATLDAAARYLEAAAATPATLADRRLDRARLAAECLFIDLSETVHADAILEAALGGARPGPARAEARSLRAILRYYYGNVADALELGEQALEESGDDPSLRARVLGRIAFVVMQRDLERGVTLVEEAVALLEAQAGPVDPDLLANVLLLRAAGELGLVRPTRRAEIERGLRLITTDGRSWEREGADGSAFGLARITDDLDRAIAMTHDLIRSKSGPGGDDPFNLVQLSGLLAFRGEWPEARRVAEAAIEGYEREGRDLHPAWALRGVALVAALEGRVADARRDAEAGLRVATERGDDVLTVFHHHILGFVALSLGEWVDADAHLAAAAALASRMSVRHPGRFKLAGDQVESALSLGHVDRAAAIVAVLDEAARVAPTPWVLAVGARSSGLLAAARGDLVTAVADLHRALDEHERLPMPFERGRTLLALGRVHRRRREKRLADETLRAALETFVCLGATIWVDQARAELARVGRRPSAPSSLTETERQVAELAAGGLSSRQIAERAFLAPKTVGNVLGRVYDKLGIHSRAELGAVMAAQAAQASAG